MLLIFGKKRNKTKKQWRGGQGVGGKMRCNPCVSYEMRPSVVTPGQIYPFFFSLCNYTTDCLFFLETIALTLTQHTHTHVYSHF